MSFRSNTVAFPSLSLSKQELEHCGYYAEGDRPGVRLRVYPLQLVHCTNLPGETSVLTATYKPSGRYTRVFALMVSGALAFWKIKIMTNTKEELWPMLPVSALFGLRTNASAFLGPQTSANFPQFDMLVQGASPLKFEPNVLLPGATNLTVEGEILPQWLQALPNPETDQARCVLNLAFYVWEFPDVLAHLLSPFRKNTRPNAANSRGK